MRTNCLTFIVLVHDRFKRVEVCAHKKKNLSHEPFVGILYVK